MDAAELAFFISIVATCTLTVVFLVLNATRTTTSSYTHEHKFVSYKIARIVIYTVLIVSQTALSVARLISHGTSVTWVEGSQVSVLLLYVVSLVSFWI